MPSVVEVLPPVTVGPPATDQGAMIQALAEVLRSHAWLDAVDEGYSTTFVSKLDELRSRSRLFVGRRSDALRCQTPSNLKRIEGRGYPDSAGVATPICVRIVSQQSHCAQEAPLTSFIPHSTTLLSENAYLCGVLPVPGHSMVNDGYGMRQGEVRDA
ncbi:hypothetical protein GALMADRAFT_277776 [Galerina marginata CBS 339.88]|uniref:Uncharacterized protein n=1 Tax=Galerina marginata (strain CBS 339.88) TaxID=685588 RepID=A0A067THG1_GALM3|nr:hypothetical protein GALMADRAFT_277776 [Galerina marginata CBS 339.88]